MNETALTWLIFVLAFGGMIILHELGHYIAARLVNVEVEEFGLGLPTPGAVTLWSNKGFFLLKSGKRIEIPFNFRFPLNWNDLLDDEIKITVDRVDDRLVLRSIEVAIIESVRRRSTRPLDAGHIYVDQDGRSVQPPDDEDQITSTKIVKAGKTSGETELIDTITEVHSGTRFTLNWLPLGGFVRPKGENDPNIDGGLAAAKPWKRLVVLFAGPLMNLATALILIAVIISQMGGIITRVGSDPDTQDILVTEVVPNSPADQAGLQMGDILMASGDQAFVNSGVLETVINASMDIPTSFVVLRDGQELELSITPLMNEQAGRPMIGIGFCEGCEFQSITTLPQIMEYSARITGVQIYTLATLPVRLIQGTIPAEQGRLVGMKGIFDIMEQSVSSDVEVARTNTVASGPANPFNQPVQTLFILASLSISLGIFNLFPFPALDGGRIVFVLPELLFRRRVPHQFENMVHGIGMMLLLAVMIYVNVKDFIDPVTDVFP